VFRGTYAAKIDDKGRLKIPNALRSQLEKEHGTELFVTSLTGESVRLYPMPVWLAHEQKLAQLPSTLPALTRYLDRVNYYGQPADIDAQGRVVIHSRLRDTAGIAGDVAVFGKVDTLEVWNHERFTLKMQREPYTEDDARALAALGI
jgi:MraZ protein